MFKEYLVKTGALALIASAIACRPAESELPIKYTYITFDNNEQIAKVLRRPTNPKMDNNTIEEMNRVKEIFDRVCGLSTSRSITDPNLNNTFGGFEFEYLDPNCATKLKLRFE